MNTGLIDGFHLYTCAHFLEAALKLKANFFFFVVANESFEVDSSTLKMILRQNI